MSPHTPSKYDRGQCSTAAADNIQQDRHPQHTSLHSDHRPRLSAGYHGRQHQQPTLTTPIHDFRPLLAATEHHHRRSDSPSSFLDHDRRPRMSAGNDRCRNRQSPRTTPTTTADSASPPQSAADGTARDLERRRRLTADSASLKPSTADRTADPGAHSAATTADTTFPPTIPNDAAHTALQIRLTLVSVQADKQASTKTTLRMAQGANVSHADHPAPVQLAQWPHLEYELS